MSYDIVSRILLGTGEQTSDISYKKEIIKEVIYRASDLLAVGTQILPVRNLTNLDVKFTVPGEMAAQYPVPEGHRADVGGLEWPELGYSLKKCQAPFRITKEARIRGQGETQRQISMRRCVEAIAKKQDAEIIDAIIAALGATVTISAGNEWDTAKGDPETDILAAREVISHQTNVTTAELRNLALLCSTNVSSHLMKLQLIGNVQQSLAQYLRVAFGIELFESRDADLVDSAYLAVRGRNTGEHGVYTGPADELVENYPVRGVGEEWLVTKFFASKILPDVATGTTTKKIVKISNTHS